MVNRTDIIIEAREWDKTPFVHQGRTKRVACDCVGLPYGVSTAIIPYYAGVEIPNYGVEPTGDELKQVLDSLLDRVDDPQPGDVLVFRLASLWQHVGIHTGRNVIHAYRPNGEVVEHRIDQKWQRRHVATYRFRGLE